MLAGLRVMPGLRVSVSSRGLRTHIGPRPLRLHVGAGRPGVSTGAGPLTLYSSLGGRGGRRSQNGHSISSGSGMSKVEQIRLIQAELHDIENLHRVRFDAARRPVVSRDGNQVHEESIQSKHLTAARRGVPWYALSRRAMAAKAATHRAQAEIAAARADADSQHKERIRAVQAEWERLLQNEEAVVVAALVAAFEDNNSAPVAPLGVDDGVAELAVILPSETAVPDKMPGVTAAGNPSLRKATKEQTRAWYLLLVAGFVLATAKEALAAAPGLGGVRIVGVQRRDDGWTALLETELERTRLEKADYAEDAFSVLTDAATDLAVNVSSKSELLPLELHLHPTSADVLSLITDRDPREIP